MLELMARGGMSEFVKAYEIGNNDRIFPISYVAAWSMVKKSGILVNIELRPHDLGAMQQHMHRGPKPRLKLSARSFCGMLTIAVCLRALR